jgi:hypothetical protein
MKNKNFLILFVCLFTTTILFAQEKAKVGLSASIQDNSFGILIPIWFSNHFMLAPSFSVKSAQDIGTDFGVGVVPRFYFRKEKLSPYIGLKAGALISSPSSKNSTNTETVVDFATGIAFGAEYFLSDNFSFGVEAQGNLTKSAGNSDRFGNPGGINFNTGTMFLATIYF